MTDEPIFDVDGAYVVAPDWDGMRASEAREQAELEEERRRIPPEYRGRTGDQRTPDAVIQSRFPPATVGIPSVDYEPFRDFQNYQGAIVAREHPEYVCDRCGHWLAEPTFRAGGRTCRGCLGTYPGAPVRRPAAIGP